MTHDPQLLAWLDQEDAHLTQVIRAHRFAVQFVGAGDELDEPAFGYTIGLFGLGHPELVVAGLGAGGTHDVLGRAAEEVADGRDLVAGELLTWADWSGWRIVVEPLPNPGEVVLGANRFYERPVEYSVAAYQLTWARPGDSFVWEDGGADGDTAVPCGQPRPGTWRA